MKIKLIAKARFVETGDLVKRLRKRAQEISDNTSEKDSEWTEIGLMRDAADVIEQINK